MSRAAAGDRDSLPEIPKNAPLPSARRALAALAVATAAASAAAFSVPTDPPVFTNPLDIGNTFQPFVPGGVKVFQGKSDGEAEVVVDIYLTDTREFDLGGEAVECHVLQETEFTGGAVSEISLNDFAQGDDGAVYYFGEVVDTYEGGVVMGHEGLGDVRAKAQGETLKLIAATFGPGVEP
ncbi:MAG TPA: hypothetical protein VFY71_01725 [Planctomycetota bacterium]|nr:hypothetical protein [Planctomycetota bacterium]